MASCNGVRGESRNAAGIGKIEKKGGGQRKSTLQRLQSVGQERRYPPVLDPEDCGDRKIFFRGGITKKAVGINKNKLDFQPPSVS